MSNRHPSLYSSVRPLSTRALNPRHMRVQSGGPAFVGISGSSGAQIPFDPHFHAHTVDAMPVNPPNSGGLRSLHPGYDVRRHTSVRNINILIKLVH